MSVRIILVFTLTLVLLMSVCDGKRGRKNRKQKYTSLIQTAEDIQSALAPAQIVKPSRRFGKMDLAKLTEDSIVNENLRLSTQLLNWLNRVVDVGKGITNGVCRSVKLV